MRLLATLAVLGPGLVSGFADNDAGGITTYSLAGAKFGYALLWVLLWTQVILFFTQEVGARLGLATGKGLMGLIRERWGVRWGAFAVITMLVANLGSTVAEFAGIGSALGLFGIPTQLSAAVAAVIVVGFIALGSYGRVQYLFVGVGIFVSVAYVISAYLAGPDWQQAFHDLIVPQLSTSPVYWLAVVGTVGTTITPWGQAFIQSYVVDKRLRPEDLPASRVDVFSGALLTNVIAFFIVVACAATLYATGQTTITDAAQAAKALEPLAGSTASVLFAVGLLGAAFLGLGVVPLTSAYSTCETFGWETGVDWNWREAPGLLRAARLLHRVRGPVRDDPRLAAHPGHVRGAGRQRAAASVHPGLRDAAVGGSQAARTAGQRPSAPDDRLDRDGIARRNVGDPVRHERERLTGRTLRRRTIDHRGRSPR